MTTRLSMSSLAGMARTDVAVGTVRLVSMLATTRAAGPRSTWDSGCAGTTSTGWSAGCAIGGASPAGSATGGTARGAGRSESGESERGCPATVGSGVTAFTAGRRPAGGVAPAAEAVAGVGAGVSLSASPFGAGFAAGSVASTGW